VLFFQHHLEHKDTEDELRTLVDVIPDFVWMMRPDGSCEYANQRWCDYTGKTAEQIQGDGWLQFIHPDDRPRIQEAWQAAVHTGTPYEVEHRIQQGSTGDYRWFLARGIPFRDRQGTIQRWFGTCTDIQDKKQAEDNLHTLVDALPQLVWMMHPDGSSEYGNQRWCDYTTLTFQQYQGDGWLQALHPDDAQPTLTLWRQALETGEPFETEYRLKNGQTGTYRWFLARAMPVRNDAGQIVKWFGTATDIDEQKRTEEALRQSQERASVLMSASMIGVNVIEGEQIVDANDTFLHMTGYTREDLYEGHMNWLQMTAPEYLARTLQKHQELATQQSMTPYEKEYVCQDGSRLPVLVCGVLLQHRPSQAIDFVLDNSARKELDQRKDDFINMASHELRNPLTALQMQIQLVRKRLEKQSHHEAATALSRVERPVKQLERLIAELLDVSKIQAGRLEYIRETVDLVLSTCL
jgi:PAS domain S-box-containing protein